MKHTGIFTLWSLCFCLLFVAGCGGSPKVERIVERRLRLLERVPDLAEPIRGGIGRTGLPQRDEVQPDSDTEGVVTRWFRKRVTGRAASSRAGGRFASGSPARKLSSLSSTRSKGIRRDDFPLEDEVARPARAINIGGLRSPGSEADQSEPELTREDLAAELLGEEPLEEEALDDMEVYEEEGADDDLESILEDLEDLDDLDDLDDLEGEE